MRSISGRRARTARGVKPGFATRRTGPCRGGSSMTTISDGGICITGAPQRDALRAREEHRLLRDLEDVGVLRDRPERFVPLRREAGHGSLGSQARPQIVGIPGTRVARGVDEIEGIDMVRRHRPISVPSVGRGCCSAMMLRWISLVPPMIELARVDRNERGHLPPSTASSSPGISREPGPSTESAVSARRWLVPAQNSFTRLDSEPISSPRAMRPSVRALWRRKISTSIHERASC